MKSNCGVNNDKNMQELAAINKVAIEYACAKSDGKREVLYTKLCEKCLGYLLNTNIFEDSEELEKKLNRKLEQNENNTIEGRNWKRSLNTQIFMETFKYALEKYCEDPVDEFTRLFLSTYSIRNKASEGIDRVNEKLHGLSTSDYERRIWRSLNRLIETVAETDVRFANIPLYMLSEKDIHYILDKAGVGFKNERHYVEVAKRYLAAQHAIELDKNLDEDGVTNSEHLLRDEANIATDVTDRIQLIHILREVINRASKIQKKYFICFVTIDVFNHYSKEASHDLEAIIDKDFIDYIKQRLQTASVEWQVAPDIYVADYLHVQKPAITKQRQKYRLLAKEVMANMEG